MMTIMVMMVKVVMMTLMMMTTGGDNLTWPVVTAHGR